MTGKQVCATKFTLRGLCLDSEHYASTETQPISLPAMYTKILSGMSAPKCANVESIITHRD